MGGLISWMQPHQRLASKQGGILSMLIAPEAHIAGKSSNPFIKAANPTNLLKPAPPPGASKTLLMDGND